MLSADLACQMDIFWHYCYMLSMNSTQVGIINKACQVVFGNLLQMPGWCKPGGTGHVPHMPVQFHAPGTQKVTCR